MSTTDLDTIRDLRAALNEPAAAWDIVERLTSQIEGDQHVAATERQLLSRLRTQISDLILAERDGLNLHTSAASVTLGALEGSLKRRTTGLDGWPLA